MMEVLDKLIALFGVAVAGAAIWLAHRQRISPYKQVLYSRQLDAYVAMMESAYSALEHVSVYWHQRRNVSTQTTTLDLLRRLSKDHITRHALLSKPVADACGDFISTSNKLTQEPDNVPFTDVIKAFNKLMYEIHRAVGVEAYTEETLKERLKLPPPEARSAGTAQLDHD